MKTVDIKFSELCDEIDYWKERAIYWEEEAEKIRERYSKTLDDSIKNQKEVTGQLLTLSLMTK